MKKQMHKYLFIAIIGISLVAACIASSPQITSMRAYSEAGRLFADGEYEKAAEQYALLGDYRDSKEKKETAMCAQHYHFGLTLLAEGEYQNAIVEFSQAQGYADSQMMIEKTHYAIGESYVSEEYSDEQQVNFVRAAEAFKAANNYQNSYERVFEIGVILLENYEYDHAQEVFKLLDDSVSQAYYHIAGGWNAFANKEFGDAILAFEKAKEVAPEIADIKIPEFFPSPNEAIRQSKSLKADRHFSRGELAAAEREYRELTADYANPEDDWLKRLEWLEQHRTFVDLTGRWKYVGESLMTIHRLEKGKNSGMGWKRDFELGTKNFYMDVRCKIADDETIILDVEGTFERYVEWSDTADGLEIDDVCLTFTQPITSAVGEMPIECAFSVGESKNIGGIRCSTGYIGKSPLRDMCPFRNVDVVFTYDGDNVSLDYTYLQDSYHIDYDYEYHCEFTYGNKVPYI